MCVNSKRNSAWTAWNTVKMELKLVSRGRLIEGVKKEREKETARILCTLYHAFLTRGGAKKFSFDISIAHVLFIQSHFKLIDTDSINNCNRDLSI